MDRHQDREITAEWLTTLRTGEQPLVDHDVAYGPGNREPEAVRRPTRTLPGYRPSQVADLGRRPTSAASLVWPKCQPTTSEAGNGQILFVILFWFALVCSVELWWLDTPTHSLTSTNEVLIAAGRITGMVAGFVLLAQLLLMSRVGWLERGMGSHSLLTRHRELGGLLVVTVLAHMAFIIVGYAGVAHQSIAGTTWSLLTTYEDMISAFVATGLLVLIGVLAVRAIRRVLRYEVWYYIHVTSYLVLLLSYGHQFADGQELVGHAFGHWYWISLYVFVLACLAWGRVIGPIRLNLRHRLRVAQVVAEAPDMISIYITGRRLPGLNVRAGQYFRWRFLTRGRWWQAHPFSLSAAPNERWLRLTVKTVGDHTDDLRYLRPGARVFAEGPSGVFTAERRVQHRALLIAGGSGIAPIRALLEELPPGAVVIYRARSEDELVFRDELEWLARDRGAQVWYVLGGRDDPGPRKLFTQRGMRELVPDVRRRDVYLCGPQGLVETSVKTLQRMRVPRRQIHLDPFEF
jgi:predicted ferric reductase